IKPNKDLAKRLYCSWRCVLDGERPHIYRNPADGQWKSCAAMTVTAQVYVSTFCGLGKHFNYMALADRYRRAQDYCRRMNDVSAMAGITNSVQFSGVQLQQARG